MTKPDPTPSSASPSASPSASLGGSGAPSEFSASPSPSSSMGDALNEPSPSASPNPDSVRPWTPAHPATRQAWVAVHRNLEQRASRGLWGSREIAITMAQSAGLDRKRAADLIRSAIKHGYLIERASPFGQNHTSQVRLPLEERRDG